MSSEKTTSNNQSNHFPTPFAQTYFHGTKAELQLGDLTKLIMCRGIMFLIVLMIITGCTKSRNQEIAEEYKDQFLTLAEFNCEGIQSDHYIYAEIDNNSFCENSNDSVQSQIH